MGIVLRPLRQPDDYAGMAAAQNAMVDAEGEGERYTAAAIAAAYAHMPRADPARDVAIAEDDGTIVGYVRAGWDDRPDQFRDHYLICYADPACDGAYEQLLDWGISRATEVAAGFVDEAPDRRLTVVVFDGTARQRAVVDRGFAPLSHWSLLVRPNLADVPDRLLPAPLELRPVTTADLRAIWESSVDAFRDDRDFVEQTETDFERFVAAAELEDLSLWQVARHGAEVVGQVRTRIDADEVRPGGRRRAWTEDISTARAWRKQGVASALICASLRQLAELGFDEAALGADVDGESRALELYRSLGYEIVRTGAIYVRPIVDDATA